MARKKMMLKEKMKKSHEKTITPQEEADFARMGGCSERLSNHIRLWCWTAVVVLCVLGGNFTSGTSHWIAVPILWFVGGTALFGLYSVGKSASNETFLRENKFMNTLLGTLAMLPALRNYAAFHYRKAISETSHVRTFPIVGGIYDWFDTDFFHMQNKLDYVLNISLVFSVAAVFFTIVLYFLGPIVLLKYYLAPWVVFQLWCSWSCSIELSLRLRLKTDRLWSKTAPANLAKRARTFFRKIGQTFPLAKADVQSCCSALGSMSPFTTELYAEAARCGWKKRIALLKVFEFFFGSDVLLIHDRLPSASEICQRLVDAPIRKKQRKVSVAEETTAVTDTLSPLPATATKRVLVGNASVKKKKARTTTQKKKKTQRQLQPIKWTTVGWLVASPLLSIYGLATTSLDGRTLALGFLFYWLGGLGITAGYHRLFSHRAYKANPLLSYTLLAMGTSAFEGSCLWWCSDHRTHHRYTDTERDPYNSKEGFVYSHVGWLFRYPDPKHRSGDFSAYSNIRDLAKDPILRFQHNFYAPLAFLFGIGLPCAIAGYFWGDWRGGLFVAGFLKSVVVQHSTFCINSLAHMWGDETFSDQRTPRDNWLISLLTFGEGYHNFHHEFPYDYRNGIHLFDWDPTKWLINVAWVLGLAFDLKIFPADIIEQGRLKMMQKRLDEKKSEYFWGHPKETLPTMTPSQLKQHVDGGAKLLVIDDTVHDVNDFMPKHPAGPTLIRAFVGKDATKAFNGGSYNHSYGARHILDKLRVARLRHGGLRVPRHTGLGAPTTRLHIIGELSDAQGFERKGHLYCKWTIVDDCGNGKSNRWTLAGGEKSGTTQVASVLERGKIGSEVTWNHPIDVHYKFSSLRGWPRIVVEVWHVDEFDRHIVAGYGFCFVPTVPGEHALDCVTWRPTGSRLNEIRSFFMGDSPRLKDAYKILSNDDKVALDSASEGVVNFRLFTMIRGPVAR
eukprot:g2375.t1